jgi:hypothetical protein
VLSAPGNRPPATAAARHVLPFALTIGALAAGWTAAVTADGATWFGLRGPACPLGACFGPLACPGCGLVRGTAAALQGDLALAFAAHPAGIVIAALLLAGAVLHFDVLRRRREVPAHRRWRRVGRWLFLVALPLGWLARILAA